MNVIERGSGTPIVLLHGFGVDHRLLLPLDPVIDAVGGWRRIYLDLPGHGATPGADADSAEDVVAAVTAEIASRLGDAPFAVLGNSFGGMIARRIAHDARDRVLGLGLIAPVIEPVHARRDVPAKTVLVQDADLLAANADLADAYAAVAVEQTADNLAQFREHVLPGLRAADTATMDRIAASYVLHAVPEEASSEPFTAPSLFLTGRQDDVVGYRDLARLLEHYPRATSVVLDGAGHNVHLDRPEETAMLLADWLKRMAP
ncbi:alpha/beta fold hydrolase [Microbacterium gorillae]|uniref:alpha/beta fold hydrolase n=1 Tax=Microbacterium gorillae TaxID=1231063 RepID=UPI000694CDBA|nr:alpha/beta hydrolase [Microbacterium gorillae]